MQQYTPERLIELLQLRPHPEGGRYAFVARSGVPIPAGALPGIAGERDTCSYIYYFLEKGQISRWHQLKATEVWTWHMGGSLEMTLGGTGGAPVPERKLRLGPRLEAGEPLQLMAPADQWQTTRVIDGDYVLVSCVVCPAFEDEDCLLPEQPLPNEIYG